MNILFVLACAALPQQEADVSEIAATATPIAALPSKPQAARQAEQVVEPATEAPAGTHEVQALLLAHHTEDLPERSTIDMHGDGAEILAWLVVNEPALSVRERALVLLGQYDALVFCGEQLQSEQPKLRAAAVHCLAGKELSPELSAELVAALDDADPRVRDAAQKAAAVAQP